MVLAELEWKVCFSQAQPMFSTWVVGGFLFILIATGCKCSPAHAFGHCAEMSLKQDSYRYPEFDQCCQMHQHQAYNFHSPLWYTRKLASQVLWTTWYLALLTPPNSLLWNYLLTVVCHLLISSKAYIFLPYCPFVCSHYILCISCIFAYCYCWVVLYSFTRNIYIFCISSIFLYRY